MASPSRALFVLAAIAGLLPGCDGDGVTDPAGADRLELDRESVDLQVQEEVVVAARVLDVDGMPVDVPAGYITWSTADERIVEVEGGAIRGIRPGTTTVTARAGSLEPISLNVQVEPRPLEGRLAFEYRGEATGTFEVDSEFTWDPVTGATPPDFAFAYFHAAQASHNVLAESVRVDGRVDLIWFWLNIPLTSPGQLPMDGALVFLAAEGQSVEGAYEFFVDGMVTLETVTGERLAGTFELTVQDASFTELVVTSGSFDVPRVTEEEIFPDP